jgi:dihydroorotate dehydrogenase (NAD+) catalytic subunit
MGGRVMLNLKIGNMTFESPVFMMSGIFSYGEIKIGYLDYKKIGAIVTKTITLKPREGNPQPRIWEVGSGMLNSIGLQNPGIDGFLSEHLLEIKKRGLKTIISVSGQNSKEVLGIVNPLVEAGVQAIEINLSCPNVHRDRLMVSQSEKRTYNLVKDVKAVCKDILLIVKLSPNVTDISKVAVSAQDAGADALSLINTVKGLAVDIEGRRVIEGGLSGPPIKPIGLKSVYDVFKKVTIPIIGIGGIENGKDALEYLLLGASAVGVGSGFFSNPGLPMEIYDTVKDYLSKHNYKNIKDITGLFNEKKEEVSSGKRERRK